MIIPDLLEPPTQSPLEVELWLAVLKRAVEDLAGHCLFEERVRRSEEHTSELQSQSNLVCRLLPENKHRRVRGNHVERTALGGRTERPPERPRRLRFDIWRRALPINAGVLQAQRHDTRPQAPDAHLHQNVRELQSEPTASHQSLELQAKDIWFRKRVAAFRAAPVAEMSVHHIRILQFIPAHLFFFLVTGPPPISPPFPYAALSG